MCIWFADVNLSNLNHPKSSKIIQIIHHPCNIQQLPIPSLAIAVLGTTLIRPHHGAPARGCPWLRRSCGRSSQSFARREANAAWVCCDRRATGQPRARRSHNGLRRTGEDDMACEICQVCFSLFLWRFFWGVVGMPKLKPGRWKTNIKNEFWSMYFWRSVDRRHEHLHG